MGIDEDNYENDGDGEKFNINNGSNNIAKEKKRKKSAFNAKNDSIS